jgi:hypothetical protein
VDWLQNCARRGGSGCTCALALTTVSASADGRARNLQELSTSVWQIVGWGTVVRMCFEEERACDGLSNINASRPR